MALKLFIPGFIGHYAPPTGQAVVQLLKRLGVPWEYPADQTWCGQFALSLWFSQRA